MKAMLTPLVVLFLLLGGCKPPAEDYIKKAEEAEKGGLWSVALEHYTKLIDDHPGSEFAEKALFNIAAIQHNGIHDFQAAVDAYKRYVEKYPDGPKAPTALFLAGFLYNNELKILDSAQVYYRQFLAKYPSHEMASSAQFELENLGRSADELLPTPEPVAESASKASGGRSVKPAKKN